MDVVRDSLVFVIEFTAVKDGNRQIVVKINFISVSANLSDELPR